MQSQSSAIELTYEHLVAALEKLGASPIDEGTVELIVRRPADSEREVLQEGSLDVNDGLVGDKWRQEALRHSKDGIVDLDDQLTLMNSRVIDLIAGGRERWPLAGDQLFVDLDLGAHSIPPGTRLSMGSAVIEISAAPHTGCGSFAERYGADARRFVNAPEHRELQLRGVNARVIQQGVVRVGDVVRKA